MELILKVILCYWGCKFVYTLIFEDRIYRCCSKKDQDILWPEE